MAIVYTYPKTTDIKENDLFILSKMSESGRPTKSVRAEDLATFIAPLIPSGGVQGSGTTNTIPIWTDVPSGVLGDSFVTQDIGGNIKLRPIDGGGNFSEFTFNTGGTFKDIASWEFRVVNGGFYKKSFKFESKEGISIGRSSISGNVILDVGDSGDTKPAAWFRNGVVVSNNPSGVTVDNTSIVYSV